MASGIAGTSTIFASVVFHCAPNAADPSLVIQSTTNVGGREGATAGRSPCVAANRPGESRCRCGKRGPVRTFSEHLCLLFHGLQARPQADARPRRRQSGGEGRYSGKTAFTFRAVRI